MDLQFLDRWIRAVDGAFDALAGRFGVGVAVLWTAAGFLLGILAALLFAAARRGARSADRVREARSLRASVDRFTAERARGGTILHDLDIGIIAYSSVGLLMSANPAALRILDLAQAPVDLNDFLSRYGDADGLRAALLLGGSGSAVVRIGERRVRIRMKVAHVEEEPRTGGRTAAKAAKAGSKAGALPGARAGTVAVLQDITEQEREEKRRKEFVENVSHELKTPLTTIKTYSESLLDWGLAEKDADGVRTDVWRIHQDSLRMQRLIDDLLLLANIDSGKVTLPMELTDVAPVVRMAVDRLKEAAAEKGIVLACYTVARLQAVFVDRTKIDMIVTNLVSNAIKYTEKGGGVTVYVGLLLNDVYVKVADTGVGIDKENLAKIFDRFYRVDRTGSRMFGGTGLGLSIARELAELHGGSIEATSVLGKGSSFVLRIPIAGTVFRDALETVMKGLDASSPLQKAALKELLAQAIECRAVPEGTQDLSKIDAETAGRVVGSALTGLSCEDAEPVPAAVPTGGRRKGQAWPAT